MLLFCISRHTFFSKFSLWCNGSRKWFAYFSIILQSLHGAVHWGYSVRCLCLRLRPRWIFSMGDPEGDFVPRRFGPRGKELLRGSWPGGYCPRTTFPTALFFLLMYDKFLSWIMVAGVTWAEPVKELQMATLLHVRKAADN